MQSLVQDALDTARRCGHAIVVSAVQRLDPIDPLVLFSAANNAQDAPFYWETHTSAGTRFSLVGFGAAAILSSSHPEPLTEIATQWEKLLAHAVLEIPQSVEGVGPLLFGGARFDPLSPSAGPWERFPAARFTLPRLLVTCHDTEVWCTTSVLVEPTSSAAEIIASLREEKVRLRQSRVARSDTEEYALSLCTETQHEVPSPEVWKALVARTSSEIQRNVAAKVVLARKITTRALGDGHELGARALERLRAAYPTSFLFAYTVPGNDEGQRTLFLGASPERLIHLCGRTLETACLAGSIGRGATPEVDAALGQELLSSVKDRAEHALVAQMIRETLEDVCEDLQLADTPVLRTLPHVQHLYTPVQGTLKTHENILALLARLHPTPAVAGYPRAAALEMIRTHEGWDRGWYAGPLGWVDRHQGGEFAVALRCALLRTAPSHTEVSLFAGCGIMGDSDPEKEYQESQIKIRTMQQALT